MSKTMHVQRLRRKYSLATRVTTPLGLLSALVAISQAALPAQATWIVNKAGGGSSRGLFQTSDPT